MKQIPFSPPDITEKEIGAVTEVLKSGWITTGAKTKEFERKIAKYCGTDCAVCLNSATACLEMTLRILGIEEGDEIITSAYTYTASASVIDHVGAKIVLVDTAPNSYEMDYTKLENLINPNTKAIISVDIAGVMCDYNKLFEIVKRKRQIFKANNLIQEAFNRVIVIADGAHSFGASYCGKQSGAVADFTTFSFHAVKNLTTGEGGAVTWRTISGINNTDIYKEYMLLSLHGQSKDALSKNKLGAWEYDIVAPNYKCNMTDIMAAIGVTQLERYDMIMARRHDIINNYMKNINKHNITFMNHYKNNSTISSGHLFLMRINNFEETDRNKLIEDLANKGIATNVHYKPLPMLTAYKNLGFNIKDYPNAYNQYKNEITLPLYQALSNQDVETIIKAVNNLI